MADLPEYQRQGVVGQGAGVIAAPRSGILDSIGVALKPVEEGLTRVAIQDAEQKGALDGVQRDANGKLVFAPRTEFTKFDAAYNRAAQVGYVTEFANDHQMTALEAGQKFRDNPEGFQEFWKGHMQGVLEQVPAGLRGDAAVSLSKLGAQVSHGILQQKIATDYKLSVASWSERYDSVVADMRSLASSGGVQTDEYKTKSAELERLL